MAVRNPFRSSGLSRSKSATASGFKIGSETLVSTYVEVDPDMVKRFFVGKFSAFGEAEAVAVKQVREEIVRRGRDNIRAAGFPEQWATAFQSRQYPKRGNKSLSVEAFVNYKFGGVGSVFEFGATSKPLRPGGWLWIPREGLKKTIFDPGGPGSKRGRKTRTAGRVFRFSNRKLEFAIIADKQGRKQPALVFWKKRGKKRIADVQFWGRKEAVNKPKWKIMPIIKAVSKDLPAVFEYNLINILRGKGNG